MLDWAKRCGADPQLIKDMEAVQKLNALNLPPDVHALALDGLEYRSLRGLV